MAKKKVIEEQPIEENISVESLDGVMGDKYAIYAKCVIQDRAIPDVRDGLKPVQRRIIYSMFQNGNTFDKPTKKCAKIVGDVMGRFHPHGDSSIYEALVRMSQDWKMSAPLITFQGNNGSIDNDPAAAYRYTEAKLNEFSSNLVEDINKNTVDMTLNFDDTEFEPVVLPAKYPNLYVNGASGIAVAIATEIPPHNLNEICEATIYRIQHPHCELDDLLEIVKGPDFPTGGIIYAGEGIRDIYATGRGKIQIASKVEIDTSDKNHNEIIITEIPYGVVKLSLVSKIIEFTKSKTVDGILDVKDLSSGDDIKIVVELKKEANPDVILQFLMKKTDLCVTYNSNIVAICNNTPKTLDLITYLDYYINYQTEIITRKSQFELKKAKDRLHIVEGLIKSVSIINEIVAIIRRSKDKADSKANLMKEFGFTELQAEAIVTMRLYRLSNTDVKIYIEEKANLENTVKDLEETLSNDNKVKRIIINQLKSIIKKYDMPRRTVIEEKGEEIQIDKRDLIAKEDVYVAISSDGYIKRSSLKSYKSSNSVLPGLKDNDVLVMSTIASTYDFVLCFTNKGNYLMLPVHEILEGKWKDEGKHVNYMCNLPVDEKIIKCILVKDFEKNVSICLVSKQNQIKKTMLPEFYAQRTNKTITCMKLLRDDEVVDVCVLNGNSNILLIAKNGKSIYFNESNVAPTKLRSCGIKCFSKLEEKNPIVGMFAFKNDERSKFALFTDKGMLKICDSSNLELSTRTGKSDVILKSFKSDVHNFSFGLKLNTKLDSVPVFLRLATGETKEYNIDNFYLTPQEKYCKKSIEELSDKELIKGTYYFDVETVDEDTVVEKSIETLEPTNIKPKKEQGTKKEVHYVEIDDDDIDTSDNFTQLSIFDDMGD